MTIMKHFPSRQWRIITLSLLFCHFFQAVLFSDYRHPVHVVRITSLFGGSRLDHFHNGIDYGGKQPIIAIDKGRVIYIRDTKKNPHTLRLGTGNAIVLEHRNKMRSYYFHIEEESTTDELNVEKGEKVAIMGDTGSSYSHHLHLIIESVKEKRIYNPLLLLPKVPDHSPPYIVSTLAQINKKIYRLRNNTIFRYSGPLKIITISWDNRLGLPKQRNPMKASSVTPYQLEFWVDEQLQKTIDFHYLTYEKGEIRLASGQRFDEVYGYEFNFYFGDFLPNKSKHIFKIVARDRNKNYREISYRVFFR